MPKRFFVFAPVLMTFIVTMALPSIAEEPAIVKTVRQKYENAETLEAVFELNIYWAVREKQEKKKGHLWAGPSDKFRVELNKTTWVCDGRTFWQYAGHSEQVIVKNLLDVDLAFHPSRILSTYLTEPTFETIEETNRKIVVQSVPTEGTEGHIKSITLTVDKKSVDAEKLVIVDKNNNTSTYTFKKIRINHSIPNDTFTFEPPADAQILDMRS